MKHCYTQKLQVYFILMTSHLIAHVGFVFSTLYVLQQHLHGRDRLTNVWETPRFNDVFYLIIAEY